MFVSDYKILSSESDQKLKQKIEKSFLKKMEKSRTLIKQENLFEGLQKLKFIDGVRGVVQKAIFSILKVLDWIKVQDYSEFLSEGAKANFSVMSGETQTKYSESNGSVKSLKLFHADDFKGFVEGEKEDTILLIQGAESGLFKKSSNKPHVLDVAEKNFSPDSFKKVSNKVVKSGKKVNQSG